MGVLLLKLVCVMMVLGLLGLEVLLGFFLIVGGVVVMNVGCYGMEMKDVFIDVECLDWEGCVIMVFVEEMELCYCWMNFLEKGYVVILVCFFLCCGDVEVVVVCI